MIASAWAFVVSLLPWSATFDAGALAFFVAYVMAQVFFCLALRRLAMAIPGPERMCNPLGLWVLAVPGFGALASFAVLRGVWDAATAAIRVHHVAPPRGVARGFAVLTCALGRASSSAWSNGTHFRAQESGAFIHMTSTSGLIGSVGQVNYAAAKLGIAGMSRGIAGDAARYGVRSNCIGPHAFSRMIESIPGQSEAQLQERAAKTRPDQVAQLAAFLASDAAKDVTGQIFGARGNEIYLYSQPRPIRTMHRGDGWTAEKMAESLLPAWRNSFTPLERTRDVYPYDAI